jgi:hypothetical protein
MTDERPVATDRVQQLLEELGRLVRQQDQACQAVSAEARRLRVVLERAAGRALIDELRAAVGAEDAEDP